MYHLFITKQHWNEFIVIVDECENRVKELMHITYINFKNLKNVLSKDWANNGRFMLQYPIQKMSDSTENLFKCRVIWSCDTK